MSRRPTLRPSLIAGGTGKNGRPCVDGRLPRRRGARRRRPGPHGLGPADLHHRRPARQGGRRIARARARGLGRVGSRAAAQAHHRQPGAGGCLEGGQPFRLADRARPVDRHGRAAGRRGRRLRRARRTRPRRRDPAGRRRAAGDDRRRGHRARRHLPGGQRRRSGLGRRPRRAGGALALGADQPFQGHAGAEPARAAPRRAARRLSRSARHQGPGDRQAGAGGRRGRRATC